jgi:hypothetical protein
VAFDAAGGAIAIWERQGSPIEGQLVGPARRRRANLKSEIVAAIRPAGGAFAAPQRVSDPRFDTGEPSLSVNASGQAAIVWVLNTKDDRYFRIGGAFRESGQAFGQPRFLTPARADATGASVALDDQGRSLFAWRLPVNRPDPELSAFRIVGSFGTAGTPTGRLRPLSGTLADYPEIAMTPSGQAVVSWVYNGSYGDLVQARRARTGGRFGPLLPISPRGGVDNLDTVIDDAGRATFVWTRDGRHTQRLEATTLAP